MGVPHDASQDEIKRAHRLPARKYHPDVSKEADAEKRFKEMQEAYEIVTPAAETVEAHAFSTSAWRGNCPCAHGRNRGTEL